MGIILFTLVVLDTLSSIRNNKTRYILTNWRVFQLNNLFTLCWYQFKPCSGIMSPVFHGKLLRAIFLLITFNKLTDCILFITNTTVMTGCYILLQSELIFDATEGFGPPTYPDERNALTKLSYMALPI